MKVQEIQKLIREISDKKNIAVFVDINITAYTTKNNRYCCSVTVVPSGSTSHNDCIRLEYNSMADMVVALRSMLEEQTEGDEINE